MVTRFTRADYERLPYKFPAQLVRGLLIRNARDNWHHAIVKSRFLGLLMDAVGVNRVCPGPIGVAVDEFNVYHPDAVVLREIPPGHSHYVVPRLVVMVLLPDSARRDRGVKRRRLLASGVDEVWIVDLATETVEVYDKDGCRAASGEETLVSKSVPALSIVPARLFHGSTEDSAE